jgi:hypothetical protein
MAGKKTKKAGIAKLVPLPKSKGQQASDKAKADREARKAERDRQAQERKTAKAQDKAERREAQAERERVWAERRAAKATAKEQARAERERLVEEHKAQREETHPCFCGCGTLVAGKTLFAMGHDGRMHGWFVRATRDRKPEPMPPEASDGAIAGLEVWSKDRTLTMREVASLVMEQAKAVVAS